MNAYCSCLLVWYRSLQDGDVSPIKPTPVSFSVLHDLSKFETALEWRSVNTTPVTSVAPARPAAVHFKIERVLDGFLSGAGPPELTASVTGAGVVATGAFGSAAAATSFFLARRITIRWYWPPTILTVRCAGV